MLLAAAGAVVWTVGHEVAAAPDSRSREAAFASAADTLPLQEPRPFSHSRHEALSCVDCHRSEGEPEIVTLQAPGDCAACHHDPGRGYTCQTCHTTEQLSVPRSVEAHMALTVWTEPRTRTLPFDHERHGEVECRDCHTAPVSLAVETACATCHVEHHGAQAECATCHVPAPPGVHGLEVHLTCASAGCHGGSAGERPTLTRSLCLTCHVEQRDHEPGLTCQHCHMIPEEPRSLIGNAYPTGARP